MKGHLIPGEQRMLYLGVSLQAILYKKLALKDDFDSLAVYQRDFVLGRNPWGLTFINKIGTEYPRNIHSQIFYLNGGNLPGAMVAGRLLKIF